ncbi:hypothetical protein BX666DRAFT_2067288 [Dichotomocladium elegans]|nr:hypothetical protein BX666DRAFT_2067286 [Dichotomocladium elegans]KAI9312527.1 hypothetical protein BX666DRAFT_2067288 [Dichotomocladium elegans]
MEPIGLTLCVRSIRAELMQDLRDCENAQFLKQLPCDYWAKQDLIMTPSTIENHLNEPLHPLVALEYMYAEQQCSLLGLEHRDDPTVKTTVFHCQECT